MYPVSPGPKGHIFLVNLALGSIQGLLVVSIAPESLNSKSAGCQAVTLVLGKLSYSCCKKKS